MNESEVLEAINLHAANGISSFTIFLSFTFAYIIAAYLAGEKLTTLQVSIISCIYFSAAFGWAASTLTHTHSFETLVAQYPEYMPSPLWRISFSFLAAIIFVPSTFASLYFMYDVRRRKKLDED
tara:strand:- start:656 stop:1027 length:372 start_codon:yes stop_codon:yes gene_type:complete